MKPARCAARGSYRRNGTEDSGAMGAYCKPVEKLIVSIGPENALSIFRILAYNDSGENPESVDGMPHGIEGTVSLYDDMKLSAFAAISRIVRPLSGEPPPEVSSNTRLPNPPGSKPRSLPPMFACSATSSANNLLFPFVGVRYFSCLRIDRVVPA